MSAIDPTSHVPMYIQIIKYLTEEIENGTYRVSEQIPPETTLAEHFGVSRITVTNAIQRMVQEGILYRIQGKGTFVAPKKKMEHRLSSLVSFTDDMLSRGYTPQNKMLEFELTIPPENVSQKLGLLPTDKTWRIERVRYADNEPMAVQTAYLPEKMFPDLAREKIETASLYKVLQDIYHVNIAEADETYRIVTIDEDKAEMLNVPSQSPALYSVRITSLTDGRIFEYTESFLRGDRYVLSVKVKA